MKEDRFLTVILIVIALLVVASLVVFFVRQGEDAYRNNNTPTDVLHDYILAIQNGDFERAYSYLAAGKEKPTFDEFEDFFLFKESAYDDGVQFGEARINGDSAAVPMTIMHGSGRLFFEGYDSYESAQLVKQDGFWKISDMSSYYRYWGWGWYSDSEQ